LALLAACATSADSLGEIDSGSDWNLADGDALASRFQRDMRQVLTGKDISAALSDLRNEGVKDSTRTFLKLP
jgi:hypothetical protein